MSEPILPLRQWPAGIPQASVPANDNALRLEALSRPVLGVADDHASGDEDGDVWIVGDTPTGAFALFDENDLALYHVNETTDVGGWQAWAPVVGLRVVVNDVRKVFNGAAWVDDPSITGGGGVPPVVTYSGASLTADETNAGNYTRFTNAGLADYVFDGSETYTVGDEYHGRAVGAAGVEIVEAGGMTINPPAGGTLVIPQGGTFTVKIVASDEADLFGVTEASS